MTVKKQSVKAKTSKPSKKSPADHTKRQMEALERSLAVIEFDLDGTVLYANDNFLKVLGYERDEVVGAKHRLFLKPDYAQSTAYVEFWNDLRTGHAKVAAFERRHKSGKSIYIQATYTPVLNEQGKPYKVLKVASDITTEREQEIENARQRDRSASEAARVTSAIDATITPIMMADAEFNISYLNEAMRVLLARHEAEIRQQLPGFALDSLIGTNIDRFHRQPQGTRHKLASATKSFTVNLKIAGLRIEQIVAPARGRDGKLLGYSVEWHDQTEQLAAQEEVQSLLRAAVAGDLSRRLDVSRFNGFVRVVSEGMNQLLDSMSGALGQVKTAVEQIGEASLQLRTTSQMMSSSSVQLNRAADDSANSLSRAAEMVRTNAENAAMANQLVTHTSVAAKQGQSSMQDMSAAMSDINSSAQQIAKIIKVIDEIAFQTNLLALNAAVEAARAGRHGKGFAVVAQEVRNLAERSAKAAKETAQLIEDSVAKVGQGVTIASQTRTALNDIIGNVAKVVDLAGEIATASGEQSRTLTSVNQSMEQVTEAAQAGSQQSSEVAAAAEEMGRQMELLRQRLSTYTLASAAQPQGLPAGLTPELVEKVMAMFGNRGVAAALGHGATNGHNDNALPPAKPLAATGTLDPRAVLPLGPDERGFRGF